MLFAAKLEPAAGTGRFTLDLTSLTFSRNRSSGGLKPKPGEKNEKDFSD